MWINRSPRHPHPPSGPSWTPLATTFLLIAALFAAAFVGSGCARALARPSEPALAPPSARALFEQGLQAQAAGDSARAEQYLAAALERGHPVAEVVPALLSVCIRGDRYDSALYYARARLLGDPGDWRLRYLVAALQLAIGQHDRARAELEQLVQLQPDRPEPHYLLGVLGRDHDKDPGAAARAFARYLQLSPQGRHATEARGFLRRRSAPGRNQRQP